MNFITSTLLCLASLPSIVTALPTWDDWPTAKVEVGVVVSVTTSVPESPVRVYKYLGVPYAAPHVRFSPAQPVTPRFSPYDASYYRPACIQQFDCPEATRDRVMQWSDAPPPPAGESAI
jgi:Carboxylesterase family